MVNSAKITIGPLIGPIYRTAGPIGPIGPGPRFGPRTDEDRGPIRTEPRPDRTGPLTSLHIPNS